MSPLLLLRLVHVKCIMEIDAREDGEHIRLQKGDENFEPGKGHHEAERKPSADDSQRAHKSGKDLQHGVSRHHVGEKPDRQAYRTGEIRDDFDNDEQRQQEYRNALRDEKLAKTHSVLHEADDGCTNEDEHGKSEGHGDVACYGEGIGKHSEHVGAEDEEEEGVDEGEVGKGALSRVLLHHVENEFIGEFRKGLESPGDESASAHRGGQEDVGGKGDDDHPCRRVGERNIDAADLKGQERLDFELVHRVDFESGSGVCGSDEHLVAVLLGVDGFGGAQDVHNSGDNSKRDECEEHPGLRAKPLVHCPSEESGNAHGNEQLDSHAHRDSGRGVLARRHPVALRIIAAPARLCLLEPVGEVL